MLVRVVWSVNKVVGVC